MVAAQETNRVRGVQRELVASVQLSQADITVEAGQMVNKTGRPSDLEI